VTVCFIGTLYSIYSLCHQFRTALIRLLVNEQFLACPAAILSVTHMMSMDAAVATSLSKFMIEVFQDTTDNVTELCSRLDRKRIPVASTPTKKNGAAVKCALQAMLRIALMFNAKFVSNPAALSRLLAAWESIWAWMEFVHTTCVIDAV
jgi:hypothetical protein